MLRARVACTVYSNGLVMSHDLGSGRMGSFQFRFRARCSRLREQQVERVQPNLTLYDTHAGSIRAAVRRQHGSDVGCWCNRIDARGYGFPQMIQHAAPSRTWSLGKETALEISIAIGKRQIAQLAENTFFSHFCGRFEVLQGLQALIKFSLVSNVSYRGAVKPKERKMASSSCPVWARIAFIATKVFSFSDQRTTGAHTVVLASRLDVTLVEESNDVDLSV